MNYAFYKTEEGFAFGIGYYIKDIIEESEDPNMVKNFMIKELNINSKQLNDLIEGRTKPTFEVLEALNKFTGVPLNFWFNINQNFYINYIKLTKEN